MTNPARDTVYAGLELGELPDGDRQAFFEEVLEYFELKAPDAEYSPRDSLEDGGSPSGDPPALSRLAAAISGSRALWPTRAKNSSRST
jgi:hypothetical protein